MQTVVNRMNSDGALQSGSGERRPERRVRQDQPLDQHENLFYR